MSEPTECPECGEITLVEVGTVETVSPFTGPYTFIEYQCEECLHYETS